ncbi:putative DNA-binding domain-containing protein [Aquabacterium sp. NJ1]|uniref:HvfC/BufC family peptide modification chaperone n=1 Tax=Aquabacterium sp. NJ1 TaxID=1538295 RepID=UPI0009DCF83A|nr:putative DNA-binding domain-containing protein [Aquabacterium sp. NJ1]
MSRSTELARQQAVLAAWRTPHNTERPWDASQACWPALVAARLQTDATGLRAYQLNAQATAQRVIAAHYPTLQAMLGEDTLKALALILWQEAPPDRGDLGAWGAALPGLIERHPDLQTWPWLADCARLDWARHQCERAADANLDTRSLNLLAETEPEQLHLALKPCVQLLSSDWPVVALWQAHQGPADTHEDAARLALRSGQTGDVVVWRQPWLLQMAPVGPADALWMKALLTQPDQPLGTLLAQAPTGFDFGTWLNQTVAQGWLWKLSATADQV